MDNKRRIILGYRFEWYRFVFVFFADFAVEKKNRTGVAWLGGSDKRQLSTRHGSWHHGLAVPHPGFVP